LPKAWESGCKRLLWIQPGMSSWYRPSRYPRPRCLATLNWHGIRVQSKYCAFLRGQAATIWSPSYVGATPRWRNM